MNKLAKDVGNSIIVDSVETIKDYMENGVDSFINVGVLKELPIVSTIIGGLKIAINIYDRNLLKQTLYFISELKDESISADEKCEFKKSFFGHYHDNRQVNSQFTLLYEDIVHLNYESIF